MLQGTLTLVRGDDQQVGLTVSNPDGNPYNLSGAVITFTARETINYFSNILLSKSISGATGHLDEINGISRVIFVPSDTNSLDDRARYFDIKLINQSGQIQTLIAGTLNIVPQ